MAAPITHDQIYAYLDKTAGKLSTKDRSYLLHLITANVPDAQKSEIITVKQTGTSIVFAKLNSRLLHLLYDVTKSLERFYSGAIDEQL